MRKILSSVIVLSSFISLTALATTPSRCELDLKLSPAQKLESKEISEVSEAKVKSLQLEIIKAKKEAQAVLSKVEASKEEAALLALALSSKIQEVKAVKEAAKLAQLFDVLSVEQRILKLKCEKFKPAHRPHTRVRRPYTMSRGPVVRARVIHQSRPGRVMVRPPHSTRRPVVIGRRFP